VIPGQEGSCVPTLEPSWSVDVVVTVPLLLDGLPLSSKSQRELSLREWVPSATRFGPPGTAHGALREPTPSDAGALE
jgi:hypothetical protein